MAVMAVSRKGNCRKRICRMKLLIVMAPPRPLQGLVKAKRPQILKSALVLGAALKKRMARAMKNWRCVQSLLMGKGTIRKDVNQRDHLLIEILNAKERPQVLHSRRNAITNKSRVIIFGKAIRPSCRWNILAWVLTFHERMAGLHRSAQ